MGVNGLWTVVQPCARPTNLATLNRKHLAVDASIWIYQFLKAVRDKEGNALRNSHVVGFFRRICKLLWFGILPVFVFDGGAPALKRATIQARNRRREGRREDAVKTAGKLLAVQMQRLVQEEEEKRKRERDMGVSAREEALQREELPDMENVVYAAELPMTQSEWQQNRKFRKQDAYHLPELEGGIAGMGKPDDPRIMSVEELEEYARQFNNGEDINLYDFSKIDFDGDFFKSLPPPDRYNILNAARLRSRLRMGLSKDQLDDMFPDRMAFSRFQIERVKERNHLTQRLMYEVGMTGTDLTLGVNARVAGEKDREYILVKNEGVEGGWALGVVSKEKDVGEAHKPIDVDAIDIQYQSKDAQEEDDSDEFEDVPIEGLNRLPKPSASAIASMQAAQEIAEQRQRFYGHHREQDPGADDDIKEGSLFVGGNTETIPHPAQDQKGPEPLHPEEEDDINHAIALSLQNQHGVGQQDSEDEFEDVPMPEPEWKQKSAEAAKPITARGGSAIAHVVNMRANAAVPKRQPEKAANDSDSDEDMRAVLARSRKTRKQQPKPILENRKNPFDGPLPFPKLDLGLSLFAKKGSTTAKTSQPNDAPAEHRDGDDDMAGGFERQEDEGPKPLPPWLADDTDIRESVKKQQDIERHINAEDKEEAEEEQRMRKRQMRDAMIEIESSSGSESDVEIIEHPSSPKIKSQNIMVSHTANSTQGLHQIESSPKLPEAIGAVEAEQAGLPNEAEAKATPKRSPELPEPSPNTPSAMEGITHKNKNASSSPEPIFEDIEVPHKSPDGPYPAEGEDAAESPEPQFEDVVPAATLVLEINQSNQPTTDMLDLGSTTDVQQSVQLDPGAVEDDVLFGDAEYDEFSDPEDEDLMAQMAEEAEEHARFARELNDNKSTLQNREEYEKELRQLRNQQKKDRRDADEVTQVMVTECQALLRLFGIPYITAPMEAEAQCAELVELGLVDGIVTDDSDTFLFGGNRVYKNMFSNSKYVECYLSTDLEKELSLSREQLISLAHLLGSDYTEGLPGVGPVTAVEILSEFPGKTGLQDFREWWLAVQSQARPKEADASSTIRRKFRKSHATKLFLPPSFPNSAVYEAYLHPEVDNNTEPFQWGVPDLEGLRQFLMATIGWTKERTDEVLVPVIKDMNKRGVEGTQSNITRYFGGPVGVGAKEAFAPRQRAQGSKRLAAAVDNLRANVAGEASASSSEASSRRKRRASKEAVVDDEVGDAAEEVNAISKGSRRRGKKRNAAS